MIQIKTKIEKKVAASVFNNTNLCALHGKRKTIMVKDLVLACCIQGIGMARA
jgi:histone H3/H4